MGSHHRSVNLLLCTASCLHHNPVSEASQTHSLPVLNAKQKEPHITRHRIGHAGECDAARAGPPAGAHHNRTPPVRAALRCCAARQPAVQRARLCQVCAASQFFKPRYLHVSYERLAFARPLRFISSDTSSHSLFLRDTRQARRSACHSNASVSGSGSRALKCLSPHAEGCKWLSCLPGRHTAFFHSHSIISAQETWLS